MGQLSCSLRRATPLWMAVLTRRRRAERLGVKSDFSRSRCRAVVPGVLACVHMYILYVCVYICVCGYVCRGGHVYMYIYAFVYVYVYLCIYTHVYMYVYAYLCIDCRSQYSCFSVWTVSCMRMCIRVHMYAYAHVCKCIYMCMFFALSVVCTSEQVFCAPVHVQVYTFSRCFFNINVHICNTLAAGCAYMYVHIYVYMHAYVYGCVCASMILLDALRRCC